jgi:hypothetical protein
MNITTTKGKTMNFIELGKAAHANGEHRAPADNAHVMEAIAGFKVGNPETLRIMNDFTKGFDMAVMAECAEILAVA